jgi:hypothetical protein
VITVRNIGKPVAGVDVRAEPVPEEGALEWVVVSDGRGRYRLPIEIPGVRRVRFDGYGTSLKCDVLIARGETLTHDLELAPLPSDPPYDWLEGEFVGEFTRGFEMECFVPDSQQTLDSAGKTRVISSAWVEFSTPELDKDFTWGRYRVRWVGTIAGPGRFGHLLGSVYLMTVDQVASQVPLGLGYPSRFGGPTTG